MTGKKLGEFEFLTNDANPRNRGVESMIQYICHTCDNLICETSTCPICEQRANLYKSEIYYCDHCNAPSFNKICPVCHHACSKIGSDLKPVFAKERLLIEILLGKPMAFAGKAVWNTTSNTYWIDGKKQKISIKEMIKTDPKYVIEQLKKYEEENQLYVDTDTTNEHIKKFIEVNRYRLNIISTESIDYIKNISKKFDRTSIFVSFSGGKDSTVTSHLVMTAMNTEAILHVYGDTTLEYPTTADYLKEFRSTYKKVPVLVAKNNDQDFNDLCKVVGPPSRVMRWCCTVFKTGAITKKLEQIFHGKSRILSFQGIRRAESTSRSKYDRDSQNSKITKQVAASPIIDWLDFDVWLYILANEVPFNDAYKQGFARVGCWCCPNNSGWSEFLSSIYMPNEFMKFRNVLYDFAKDVGKQDWKEYIDSGNWKARQGGNGLDYSKNAIVEFKPCAMEEDAFNFDLTRPINDTLYTLFKPFGILNFDMGNKRLNEVYVLDRKTKMPLLRLTGRMGKTKLRVTVLQKTGRFNNMKSAEELIKAQITKFQTCIACSYCQSVCKFNALKVVNTTPGHVDNDSIRYEIDESKCVGCLECVTHFDGGCYMKKVLRVAKKEK